MFADLFLVYLADKFIAKKSVIFVICVVPVGHCGLSPLPLALPVLISIKEFSKRAASRFLLFLFHNALCSVQEAYAIRF